VVGIGLARVILPRLQVLADLILPESQCGFRYHRSTIDMIFTHRQLREKCLEQREPLIVVFIDLTKAFDMVCRGGLFAILQRLGCPDTMLSIISGFHNHMQASVHYNGSTSKAFPVTRGVKQGCVLAPTLFAIYFSALLLCAFSSTSSVLLHSRSSGKLFNLSRFMARSETRRVFIRELLYADDAALVAHSIADTQVLCNSFAAACIDFGMKISLSKSVVLVQGVSDPVTITINNVVLKVVEKFCYLGSNVTASGSLVSELDARIAKAASAFGKLRSRVWANQHLSIHVKIRVYVACVLSMLLYGCETWPTCRYQKRLNAFHFRCLRSILGVSWRDHIPNTTMMERTGAPDIFSP